ncbi:uncharacterized protein LOC143588669 [Bidens hawaiensis]|uniref:uncharacterized protein LOC143588669 n=1 Tax=Bidens hawaiensis TaxID=980011 RepID=UPI00404B9646
MAETTTNEAKISIKVFVDKVKKRVVYAEADHTFVDILFSFMTLPLETIVSLLEKHPDTKLDPLGSLNNLYQSLKDFPECYFATKECKFMHLNPRSLSYGHCGELKLEIDDTKPVKWFICRKCLSNNYSNSFFLIKLSAEAVAKSFRLLTDFGITDTSNLEERKLDMGREQGEFLNKETFTSSTMLLDVSLQKSTGKLLFEEVKEDFVDFVFGFLSIPLGTVVGTLMSGDSSITCMNNILKSISNMSVGRYLKSQVIKDILLKPHFGQEYSSLNHLFPIKGSDTTRVQFGFHFQLIDPRMNEVFLKQSGMFFVTDDLVIAPSSSHMAMNTMRKLNVSFDDVEKYEISIGLEEGLRMLKASLLSGSTLTKTLEHLLKKN